MKPFVPTPEQRRVIEWPLAPVRVAAGAGTGKTSTLAYRVAEMVDRYGIRPDQVLGITFTNKAAHELAARIREVLGARLDPGETVDVFTYHGFGAHLLQDHGLRVGVERGSAVVTPTFARQLLLEAVTAATFEHTDITSRRKVIGDLDKLSSDLGDNLLTPQDLSEHIQRAATEAGEEHSSTEVDAKRAEYARVLHQYTVRKRSLDALDYADLIRLGYELVLGHPDVATSIREQYRLVLLDEYQDTNAAQRRLLQAVFGGGFPVTAVGDRDQTIYEWRGASLENFARFREHFPQQDGAPAGDAGLTLNRRSGACILDVANLVRSQVGGEPADPLRPLPDAPPGAVSVAWYRTARQEADAIASEVARLHHEESLPWKTMAVLFRKNKDIGLVRDALEDHGIPIQVANLGGLLTVPEVVEVHAWLRVLADPEDTPALARLLMGSRHRVGMGDMRRLADWVHAQAPGDANGLPQHTLLEALEHIDQIELSDVGRTAIAQFVATFRQLLSAAQGSSLVELVQQILAGTDAWRDVGAMPQTTQLSARLNLYRFLDLAESWSPLEGRPSLHAFLAYLELMQEEDIEELDTARISDDDAVTLLTVHRAKGLEWDAVFIPAAYRNNFPSGVRLYEDPFVQAAILPYELRLDRADRPAITAEMPLRDRQALLKERHTDQEWRLAYVAVTRARRYLYLSGAAWTGTPRPNKTAAPPSALLELVAGLDSASRTTWVDDPGERPQTLRYGPMDASPDPLFPQGWDAAVRDALDDPDSLTRYAVERDVVDAYHAKVSEFQEMLFSLPDPVDDNPEPEPLRTSVTGLVTYATCPRRYYWAEVDRLPRRASPAARRGVDLHRRIEMHNRGAVPFDDLDPDLYDVVPTESEGADEAESAYQRFRSSRFAQSQPRFIEVPFDLRLDDDTRIRGRIDAIYEHASEHWEIVDFKSGRPSREPAALVQLQAYALAAHRAGFAPRVPERLDVTFAYFGGGLTEHSEAADDAWVSRAESDLSSIVARIVQEQFDPAPSAACPGCDFLNFCPTGQAWVGEHSPAG